ncbi:MAG: fasciclin domain-containing protein [Halobacteriota archaeon]
MVSKKLFSAVLTTAVVLSIVAGSTVAFAQVSTTTTTTITQTVTSNADLSTLEGLLQQANLTALLNNTTKNYTLLAPNNAAFAKLNNTPLANLKNDTPKLTQILKNHVIDGKVNFTTNGTVTTLAGNTIPYTVNGTKVQFGGPYNATITAASINATNGVINVVDTVLVPPATTKGAVASAVASAAQGFLGLPGFEALYAVAGLLAVAYLVIRRRK